MYRIVKRLTRFKLVAKKTCSWRFHKGHIKKGLGDKEGLVCLSSKFSLLKPNNLVSMTRIFTCVLFAKLVSKVMYILNIRYYITEKDLSSCLSHESTWFITSMKVAKYYIIGLNTHICKYTYHVMNSYR